MSNEQEKAVYEFVEVVHTHLERILGPFVRWIAKLLEGVE